MRDPSEMTPAQLRRLRQRLSLTVRALSAVTGQSYQTITRWESGTWPLSAQSAAALVDVIHRTEAAIADLVATAPPGTVIETYRSDKELREARPDLVARIDDEGEPVYWPASWHLMVVDLATEQIPGASFDFRA